MTPPNVQKEMADHIAELTKSLGGKHRSFQLWQLTLLVIGAFLLVLTKIDVLKAIGWST